MTLQLCDDRLPDLFRRYCTARELEEPTPVQAQCWLPALRGTNVIASAPTGSGKTLGFLLPMPERLQEATADRDLPGPAGGDAPSPAQRIVAAPLALILAPTRELAQQIAAVADGVCKLAGLHVCCLGGGASKAEQMAKLVSVKPEVVVSTPGRLLDLCAVDCAVTLRDVAYFVVDEADRMLQTGSLKAQLMQLRKLLPQRSPARTRACQTLMFSATFPPEMRAFARLLVPEPRVELVHREADHGGVEGGISPSITHTVHVCAEHKKTKKLIKTLQRHAGTERAIVFCNRIKTVNYVDRFLRKEGLAASALHGELDQPTRERVLADFKAGRAKILVCTDVAARGLHVERLDTVVLWDMTSRLEQYVHRVGRTGRQGRPGLAVTFFTRNFSFLARDLVALLEGAGQAVDPNLRALVGAEGAGVAAEQERERNRPRPKGAQKRKGSPADGAAASTAGKRAVPSGPAAAASQKKKGRKKRSGGTTRRSKPVVSV